MAEAETHVLVKFFTKQQQYAIPNVPYTLPIETDRKQLSALINSCLKESSEESSAGSVEFDFLLNGAFIQSTLEKHYHSKELSAETALDIEYVERQAAPSPQQTLETDAWISSIDATEQFILTGLYDNTVQVWSTAGQSIVKATAHIQPVKSVAWIQCDESDKVSRFVTTSTDNQALVWQWQRDSDAVTCQFSCHDYGSGRVKVAHADTVTCVRVSPSGEQMCTVGWDGRLKLWSTECTPVETDKPPKKKKKNNPHIPDGPDVPLSAPLLSLEAHEDGAVLCVRYMDNGHSVVTGSMDHTLKLWDLQAAARTATIPGNKTFHDVDYSKLSHLLVTGCDDRHVRLYDPRSSEGAVVKCAFTSHSNQVKGVAWSPSREHLFMSGSYDCTAKLWDTRSPKAPLFELQAHDGAVMAVNWSVAELMVTGGQDNRLNISRLADLHLASPC